MDRLKDKCLTYDFERLFKDKGYAFFTKGAYNLNIIGVRKAGTKVTNTFDDVLVLVFNTPSGKRVTKVFEFTTQPGIKYMENPENRRGCAILVPGQYRKAYTFGLHKNKYTALVQQGPVCVYRDNTRDNFYDYDPTTIDKGMYGINIHKSGFRSVFVDGWSAGCQVFRIENDFKIFMRYCRLQVEQGFGKEFTYTLIKEEDMK